MACAAISDFALFFLASAGILLVNAVPTKRETSLSGMLGALDRLTAALETCWNYTAWNLIIQAEQAHRGKNPVWLPQLSRPPPDPKGHVHRPYLDETISLPCAVGSSQPNDVVWKHKGHQLPLNQTTGAVRHSRAHDNALILHNVTYAAWGKFECHQRCPNSGLGTFCLQAEHWVFPKPLPDVHEVYAQLMPEVTVPRYMPFAVTCQLDFPCGPNPAQHFIWRYRGMYLAWPPGHYLQQTACIEKDRQTLMIHTTYSEITGADGRLHCASTLTLHVPWPNHTGAKLACWARSDTTQQEWYILTTPVRFNGSLPFPV
ncbi:uncharacterized protein LOC129580810 [Paramacrobiotus metropolitanus]|uniref:uncharacterized protein LOC129580810 n=1 Tax=Paramacrobiotus metropolitanus TaxID=2943436 RepID=UPI0024463F46|nr:uncharacterized protein LOC129580810 [Paramacrobiotus metropolitanus]XP_055327479.1 uncharacterized protein LOC129580810 [Paramacrobiotus metropolitanus]XP_055327485.1 uncharacterized protein LOC129580810 [Paramacrobiotus metropolitanus]XP_055327494.1 uncharacterized protein LOC129580810 [Paramacrobiotus metropolitanus]XP_055327503.1 uncharacterized protein LOC129580810 [Paramacrobiotus metropolitanus]